MWPDANRSIGLSKPLEVRDSSGESSVVEADGGIFENGSFRVEYDTVIWQSGE